MINLEFRISNSLGPFALLLFACLVMCGEAFAQTAANILLLVNDNSADSKAIARYYAEKRNIPDTNVCHIRTREEASIPRDVFEREILQPVAEHLRTGGLQDRILYIVTTLGLPVVVAGDGGPAGDMASVDSELALVYRYLVTGRFPSYSRIENPYFAVEFSADAFRPFIRRDFDIYLVTRLTGATAIDAALLVDRALATAAPGGFYFDLASAQQTLALEWAQQAAAALIKAGCQATVENTGKVLESQTAVQGYLNQGTADANLADRIPHLVWNAGALATVFDKATAAEWPEKSAGAGPATVAARYVESGVTGFGAYVGDPAQDGYLRPQILFPAYASGYNLTEAFYAASRYVGWRQVIIGDPLASPYAKKTAGRRAELEGFFHSAADGATGLPEHFAKRRQAFLSQKYSTSADAVLQLLGAEAKAAAGDNAGALAQVDSSLAQDPYIAEAHELKGRILEAGQDYARAYDSYRKTLELGRVGPEIHWRIVRLALDRLKDPAKAAPSTQWLYRIYGRGDPEIAGLHADVELRCGRADEARAAYDRLVAEVKPAQAFALAGLGRIAYDGGNYELARDLLERALNAGKDTKASGGSGLSIRGAELQKLLDDAKARLAETAGPAVSVRANAEGARSGGSIVPARIVSRTPIPYPWEAQVGRISGVVEVELLIDEMGQVMKVVVLKGDRRLSKGIQDALRRWRFEPRLENGRAVVSRFPVTIAFQMPKPGKGAGES